MRGIESGHLALEARGYRSMVSAKQKHSAHLVTTGTSYLGTKEGLCQMLALYALRWARLGNILANRALDDKCWVHCEDTGMKVRCLKVSFFKGGELRTVHYARAWAAQPGPPRRAGQAGILSWPSHKPISPCGLRLGQM
jgi:hypothetical protein